ncbi:MAG: hypothetical protein KC766_02425 [Myxococcales bacterium]|nr:hypothetical protein [Myxococcales bacterium]
MRPPAGEAPPNSDELHVFAGIVRQVVREEQDPLRASIKHLSDQVLELSSRQANQDQRTAIHDERLSKLEAKRVWWPAGLALLALGVASGNLMTILYLLSRLVP